MAAVASRSRAVAASGTGTLHNVDGIMKTEEKDYMQILQLHLRSVARWLKLRSNRMFYQDEEPRNITTGSAD